jgi:hypothetical protein
MRARNRQLSIGAGPVPVEDRTLLLLDAVLVGVPGQVTGGELRRRQAAYPRRTRRRYRHHGLCRRHGHQDAPGRDEGPFWLG